jgi:hypothetical protein
LRRGRLHETADNFTHLFANNYRKGKENRGVLALASELCLRGFNWQTPYGLNVADQCRSLSDLGQTILSSKSAPDFRSLWHQACGRDPAPGEDRR